MWHATLHFIRNRMVPQFSSVARQHDHDEAIWFTEEKQDLRLADHPEVKAVILLRDPPPHLIEAKARLQEIIEKRGALTYANDKEVVQQAGIKDLMEVLSYSSTSIIPRFKDENRCLHFDGLCSHDPTSRLIATILGEGTNFYAGPLPKDLSQIKLNGRAHPDELIKAGGVIEAVPEAAVIAFKALSYRNKDLNKVLLHRGPNSLQRGAWLMTFSRLGAKPRPLY